jgi:hypothetical protein
MNEISCAQKLSVVTKLTLAVAGLTRMAGVGQSSHSPN